MGLGQKSLLNEQRFLIKIIIIKDRRFINYIKIMNIRYSWPN